MIQPYYNHQGITIYCENCLDTMRRMPDGCIDLTVTSPPYDNLRTYNGYEFDFEPIARELFRVTKQGGVVVWVVGDATINGSETGTSFRQALYFLDVCGFNMETMIWNKAAFSAVGALQYGYAPVFEFMFVLSKGRPVTFNPIKDRPNIHAGKPKTGTIRQADGSMKKGSSLGKPYTEYGQRFNIWNINQQAVEGHPAPFPEALAHDHILSWSNPNDTVYDCFLGSGTTAKMAKELGRKCVGSELSAEYCEIAVKRLSQENLFNFIGEVR